MKSPTDWKDRIKAAAAATTVIQVSPLVRILEEFVAALNESPWLRAELRPLPSGRTALICGPKLRRDVSTTLFSVHAGPRSLLVFNGGQTEFSEEEALRRFLVDFAEKTAFPETVRAFQEMAQEDVLGTLRIGGLFEAHPRDVPVRVDAAKHNELAKRALEGNTQLPFDIDVIPEQASLLTLDDPIPYRFLESGGFGLRIMGIRRHGALLRVHGDIVPLSDLTAAPPAGGAPLITPASRAPATPTEDRPTGYLSRVHIEDIRSIQSIRWSVEPRPGWNVILGDNGAGKSTFLRAIALGLLLPQDASALRLNFGDWVRRGATAGRIEVEAVASLEKGEKQEIAALTQLTPHSQEAQRAPMKPTGAHLHSLCSVGFGPFRRFGRGDREEERQLRAYPRVQRHLSLFDDRVSLSESLTWLTKLRSKELEDSSSAPFLLSLREFINQEGFLPNGVWLRTITTESVEMMDGKGWKGSIDDLSDGYRSILSLTFELIRQLAAHWGQDRVFAADARTVVASGIVLIDEADAHLHPTWQRRIGIWLREHFPNVQFIVTTHSPLVCQAADVGTVFRLPDLDGDDEGRMVTGVELDRLLYGDLLLAYATPAMGKVGRSDQAQRMLEDLARLNRLELDVDLTREQREELDRLRAIFPSSGYERRS